MLERGNVPLVQSASQKVQTFFDNLITPPRYAATTALLKRGGLLCTYNKK